MEKADFDRIRANEGGLMSISNFLSTSDNREVAIEFARDALKDRRKVSVLMEIEVGKNSLVPLANISQFSVFEKEKEWLFSMGSVFRIGPAKCLPDGVWIISLTLTDDNDEQLTALRKYFKKSMEDKNPCLNLAKLMHQLAAWKRSEYFYLISLETESVWHRRAVIFNDLGLIKSELEQYDEALTYYHQSIGLKQDQGGADTKDLASTYNNIGTLYYKQKKMDLAIQNFQQAIEVYNTASENNEDFVATLYHNIATILNDQGKYEEALKNNEKCLNIQINRLPPLHPSLASTYDSIASTFHHLRDFAQAVQYGQKAVDIDIQALPPNHPQTQIHMQNLDVYKRALANSKH
jgi:tetratricopeptide (TPR) repeat protein